MQFFTKMPLKWLAMLGLAALPLFVSGQDIATGIVNPGLGNIPFEEVPDHLKFRVIERTAESRNFHLNKLKQLSINLAGEVRLQRYYLSGDAPETAKPKGVAYYHLVRPRSKVEDAEIRGYIDGRIVHHNINQGTANHLRIGRRFSGTEYGEFEIKRALVRWTLDNIPEKSTVLKASARIEAESIATVSPIVRKSHYLPLHLYMYPVAPIWQEGRGGSIHDNYTGVVKGEVTWADARHEEQSWKAPGALDPGVMPIALGIYEKDASPVVFSGPLLKDHVQKRIEKNGNLDVLFKLDNEEEDRWGTEVGFYSSEFGDDKDISDKRPQLDLELEIPYPLVEENEQYSLKEGEEKIWPQRSHTGGKLLLSAVFSDNESNQNTHAVNPQVWVRGGKGKFDDKTPWLRLSNPLEVEWDWSQFKLSARPWPVISGFELILNLPEYWVTARYQNLPHMLALSPSGKVHETWGLVSPFDAYTYRIAFPTDELGLWRYIWFFLPTGEVRLHTHENTGMFYVINPGTN